MSNDKVSISNFTLFLIKNAANKKALGENLGSYEEWLAAAIKEYCAGDTEKENYLRDYCELPKDEPTVEPEQEPASAHQKRLESMFKDSASAEAVSNLYVDLGAYDWIIDGVLHLHEQESKSGLGEFAGLPKEQQEKIKKIVMSSCINTAGVAMHRAFNEKPTSVKKDADLEVLVREHVACTVRVLIRVLNEAL